MARRWRPDSVPQVILVGLAVAIGVTVLFGGLTSATAFGTYNSGWDGVSELRAVASNADSETMVVRNTTAYDTVQAESAVSFVLSPDSRYSDAEATRVEWFVRRGGTLVVAEDVGTHSDPLLERIGADARFAAARLRDERNQANSPTMPIARNSTGNGYAAGVDALALNHGTAVKPGNATVLVNSSSYAYLDGNGNDRLDASETLRQYPVVTRERHGEGEVIAVGDPSLFINTMLDRQDNRAFASNLVSTHRVSLFDVSHLSTLPPLVAAQFALRDSPGLQIGLGLALVVAVTYAGLVPRLRERVRSRGRMDDAFEPVDDESVAAWIRAQRPEWDRERARRVSEEITLQKQNRRKND